MEQLPDRDQAVDASSLRLIIMNRDARLKPMSRLTDDESHPIPAPQTETWFGSIRYLIAMTLITLGGTLTVVWTVFLGWIAGKVIGLW